MGLKEDALKAWQDDKDRRAAEEQRRQEEAERAEHQRLLEERRAAEEDGRQGVAAWAKGLGLEAQNVRIEERTRQDDGRRE